jgi:hypothetical protein
MQLHALHWTAYVKIEKKIPQNFLPQERGMMRKQKTDRAYATAQERERRRVAKIQQKRAESESIP